MAGTAEAIEIKEHLLKSILESRVFREGVFSLGVRVKINSIKQIKDDFDLKDILSNKIKIFFLDLFSIENEQFFSNLENIYANLEIIRKNKERFPDLRDLSIRTNLDFVEKIKNKNKEIEKFLFFEQNVGDEFNLFLVEMKVYNEERCDYPDD